MFEIYHQIIGSKVVTKFSLIFDVIFMILVELPFPTTEIQFVHLPKLKKKPLEWGDHFLINLIFVFLFNK